MMSSTRQPESEAVGVSLEVGATYRTSGGVDVVLYGVEPDRDGDVPVFYPGPGQYGTASAAGLVRVVPTPADRWQVILDNGEGVGWYSDFDSALDSQQRHGGRIAQFHFLAWGGEQSDG